MDGLGSKSVFYRMEALNFSFEKNDLNGEIFLQVVQKHSSVKSFRFLKI